MENTLWQSILNYGGLGVLTVLFYLFSRGYIVSKSTLQQLMDSHKATVERMLAEDALERATYERTVSMIAENHNKTVNQLCTSYQGTITELKAIIEAAKNVRKKTKSEG